MSSEDTEITLQNKLMEILKEEISTLNLNDVSRNEYLNETELGKGETFSSPTDNTAEVLLENNQEVKCISDETLNSLSKNKIGGDIQSNYRHEEIKCAHKKEVKIDDQVRQNGVQKHLSLYNHNQKICKNNIEVFITPSDSLAEKIMRRTESYFQDYNLFKNSFLLNHIIRNKKGYISLKLIASLRRIKSLTKDFRVVAYSIKNSKILELNPECNKVRRIEPIPKIEDTKFGKTLMIFNLPHQNSSRDYLKELFSKFGTVVSVGVFEVSSPDCDVYHERCLYFHRQIASRKYGIVEFEKYDEVVDALKDDDGHLPKENEMIVVPLLPQIYRKEKRHLKFLELYYAYPRRDDGRYRERNEKHVVQHEIPASSEDGLGNGKMNANGYQHKRGNFRRPYRGRRSYVPPSPKKYLDGQFTSNYNGMRYNKWWNESRQLKANNSFNIDNVYPSMYRKKTGYGYTENGG